MKTNSKTKKYECGIIARKLKEIPIKKLSKQSGFRKRKPQKIEAKKLIIAFLLSISTSKKNTYSSWANKLGLLIQDTVSRQAIWKRMNKELIEFLQMVLKASMEKTLQKGVKEKVTEKLKQFKRIILEDSTNIKLNEKFSKEYPGSKNLKGRDFAGMKIQTAYEIKKKRFLRFEITNFRRNDQGYSGRIIEIARAGDLIIRDLGYFVLEVFNKITEKGIYFVSRLRKDLNIYLRDKDKPIDLTKMLRKRGKLDIEVFIGEEKRLPVRLIALPVDEAVAAQRRRKARRNRDIRLNPGREYLFLLGWNLFITNVSKEQLTPEDIVKIYSIRWRIEIIFKSWKTTLGITDISTYENKIKLESYIYCMLIFILLFQVDFYNYYSARLSDTKGSNNKIGISLLKLTQFMINNMSLFICIDFINTNVLKQLLDKQVLYYCPYESRLDRLNYYQFIQS